MKLAAIAAISLLAVGQIDAQNTFPSTGNVGIGTTTPTSVLNLVTQGSLQTNHNSQFDAFSGAVTGTGAGTAQFTCSQFNMRKARGTQAAPVAVVSGDRLSTIVTNAYDGTAYQSAAQISFFADGAVAAGSVPMSMVFMTGSNPTSRADRLTVASSGTVRVHNLAGTGTRMVVADATGVLSTQAIPTGGSGSGWALTGNAATATDWLGTTNAFPLNVKTNNVNRLTVFANGQVRAGYNSAAAFASVTPQLVVVGDTSDYTNPRQTGILGWTNYQKTSTSFGVYGYNASGSDGVGVLGASATNDWYGVGVEGDGGYIGVAGFSGDGANTAGDSVEYFGGYFVSSTVGNVLNIGVYARAAGSTGLSNVTTGAGGNPNSTAAIGNWALYANGPSFSTNSWTISDARFKKNIQKLNNGLETIMKLQPKSYEYNQDQPSLELIGGTQHGFLAQELEKVIPSAVANTFTPKEYDNKNRTKVGEREAFKAVNYNEITPYLVSAIQEQQAVIDQQAKELQEIKQLLQQAGLINSNTIGANGTNNTETAIFQNVPNPFNGTTTIPYFINRNANAATITVTNAATGAVVKTFDIKEKGQGQITLSGTELASGTYTYTLAVDGKVVASKAMVLAK